MAGHINGWEKMERLANQFDLGTTSWCNLGEDSGLEYYKYEGSNR
jgi:hypothetical protein